MNIELIILIVVTLMILPGISHVPREAFKEAGPYLGGHIEKQLDTGAGFQEIALEVDEPLRWSDE